MIFRLIALAIFSLSCHTVAASGDASDVGISAGTDDIVIAQSRGEKRRDNRDDRRDDRGDNRDDRRDCRQDEGAIGDDKRECKQENRGEDEDAGADGEE
jgi:hypothetical protein